jgi:RND family efflux transporter MFP subunit
MTTRARRTTALSLGLAGLAALVTTGCERAQPKLVPPRPPEVTVCLPVTDYVTDYEEFTGRTEAIFSVEIRARVTGYLDKVYFKDGDEVKKDDPLFEIDPRPYAAEMARAEASVDQSDAHLKRLEADYRRAANLFARGNISREEYDKAAGDRNEAEASLGIARANFRLAKLNEEFTRIKAPIDGRLSRRLVDPGNLVQADMTALTTIVSLDPLYVNFDVDERTLLQLRRLVREGRIRTRAEAEVPIEAGLSDEDGFSHKGNINFSDNRVDPNTGTLRVRASIANPKPRVLSPGMFMRVRLPIGGARRSLLVPEQAVGTDQGRKYLYVLNSKDEIVSLPVEVGRLERGLRVIDKGLSNGQRVVVSGLQRVRPGAKVVPKLAEAPVRPGGPVAPDDIPAPPALKQAAAG